MPAADQPAWLTASLRRIGDRARDARILAGLTQEALAERAEVARGTIQRLEAGLPVGDDTLLRIARALRMSVTDLFT